MRKNLNLKLSWYSPDNLKKLVEDGYLPVLAIDKPEVYAGTPIHFRQIAPRVKELSLKEYKDYLESVIKSWKIVNSFDVLCHVSCAPNGVVILTDQKEDPYREILGKFLGKYMGSELKEYEYN